uniref:Uncharacterized protein n=1 Tax=candidate division WOR-3 bacterium TaxID=2052148 RepID=A0A7C4GDE6_UNCW3
MIGRWFEGARAGRILCVLLPVAAGLGAELRVAGSPAKASVSVVRRVDVDYYLLTRAAPLEFDVDAAGDTAVWLRVYTRLWWPAGGNDRERYALSLWRDELERPYEFETEVSGTSRAAGGRRVGAWRSFFVQVPPGKNRLRLTLGGTRAETVGVRFVFQSPRPWRPLELPGFKRLELALSPGDRAEVRRYYEVPAGRELRFGVSGPGRLRVRVRLNYDATLLGQQTFLLTLKDGKRELARQTLTVGRSLTARFLNATDKVPSTERVVRLELPAGERELTAVVGGTLARSAAVAVEVLAPEKYE